MKINITPEERKALIEEIHANAVAKGFWSEDHSEDHYKMLVITELSEAVEAHRRGDFARREAYQMVLELRGIDFDQALFLNNIKDSVEDELADALIRLYDIVGAEEYKINEEYIASFKECALFDCENYYIDELTAQILLCVTAITHNISEAIGSIEAVAEHNRIDLYWHVREKMKYNAGRPPLHGRKY